MNVAINTALTTSPKVVRPPRTINEKCEHEHASYAMKNRDTGPSCRSTLRNTRARAPHLALPKPGFRPVFLNLASTVWENLSTSTSCFATLVSVPGFPVDYKTTIGIFIHHFFQNVKNFLQVYPPQDRKSGCAFWRSTPCCCHWPYRV